ncbi:MAG: type II secretion system F family protein [Roseovarius sp.]|jgi:tight adherence protein C|uniref:type II secretion system F family protein n=1 Tax=Roseovarius sp. TaxID=1486281 RepID=UPI0032EAEBBE
MSEQMMPPLAWLAFVGLVAAFLALAALVESERRRAGIALRLRRANGDAGVARAASADARPSGLCRHVGARLRRIILRMGERLSVILGGEARDTAADLRSAGYKGRDALLVFAFLKTVLPLGAFLCGSVWVLVTYPVGLPMLMPAASVIAVALGLSMGVDVVVDSRRKTRLARIRRTFPDLLELLVISSEAGQGPQQALHRVAREMHHTCEELSGEMQQMVSEIAMTNDRNASYAKLNARVPLPEMAIFTQALEQSDKYGTPFARAMRNLVAEQRTNRLLWIEEKAARLPVIMTIPLIFCIMPAVFVVLVGPAALSIFDNILSGG